MCNDQVLINSHHGDAVVEKRLAEDNDVKHLIDMDFLKDGQDGDRVDCRDEAAEDKTAEDADLAAEHSPLGQPIQRHADKASTYKGVHYRHQ